MKKIIILLSILTLYISCDHPEKFVRNNPADSGGTLFGIQITEPITYSTISNSHTIKIDPIYPSTSTQLTNLILYIDNIQIATSEEIPFTYKLNQTDINIGLHNIKCIATNNNGEESKDSIQVSYILFEAEEIDTNSIRIQWDIGTEFSEFKLYRFNDINYTNKQLLTTITDPKINSYTDNYHIITRTYYMIEASNLSENDINCTIQLDSPILNVAHINNGGRAKAVVNSNGNIFLANGHDGLRAYTYNGNSFTNTAHIYDGGKATSIAINSQGIIFLANLSYGLRAYTYDGNSFTNTAHIYDGGTATGVTINSEGTIFLANASDGLRAYTYDGNSFINTAHISDNSYARGVSVNFDGTIFLANDYDGLRAYTYDGNSFTNTAHIDDGGTATGVTIDSDGTIFLANASDGLRAYTYDGNSFTNTAHIYDGGYAISVAINSNGIIFLANSDDGLRAYIYNKE